MEESAPSWLAGPLAPLRHGVFRRFWTANVVSMLGTLIQTMGAAWMMTTLTRAPDFVTLVQTAASAPIVLFSVVSGAVADNFDRRRVMLVAQLLSLGTALVLTSCTLAGLVNVWLLLVFTFVLGCGTALHNPSWQASFADMVPRADLPAAVTLNGLATNMTRGIGPAIGGAIIAAFGTVVAFALNALSYVGLIAAIWTWQRPPPQSQLPREELGPAVLAGFRYVAMSPGVQAVLLRAFVFGFTVIAVLALLPVLVRDHLGGGAVIYGLLFGAFGVGGVLGALVSGALRARLRPEWSARIGFAGFVLCATVLSLSDWAWLDGLALICGGACWVIALTMFNICVQLSTPRWVVGRSLAIYHTAVFGGQALGAWFWGLMAGGMGVQAALAVAAGTIAIGALLGFGRLGLPRIDHPNLDPSGQWKAPHLEIDILPRSGPIKVMIEYEIPAVRQAAFLEIMRERRRTRQRDGARRWSLIRDVEAPDHWVETYHFPTWLDYVRYNARVTVADAAIGTKLRELHGGAVAPKVRRLIERPVHGAAGGLHPDEVIDLH